MCVLSHFWFSPFFLPYPHGISVQNFVVSSKEASLRKLFHYAKKKKKELFPLDVAALSPEQEGRLGPPKATEQPL